MTGPKGWDSSSFHLRTREMSGSSSCNWCSVGLLYRTGQEWPLWFVGDPLLSPMTPGESSLCAAAPIGKLLSNRMKVKARVRNFHMDDSTDHMDQSGCLWSVTCLTGRSTWASELSMRALFRKSMLWGNPYHWFARNVEGVIFVKPSWKWRCGFHSDDIQFTLIFFYMMHTMLISLVQNSTSIHRKK